MVRPPTTRASGGRTLLLLGILLALAAGVIVMFVISHYTGAATSQETVVVATKQLNPGVILTSGAADATHVSISAAFTLKSVNTDFAPADAYVFTTQDDLNTLLNNYVVVSAFVPGDIVRKPDPRLVGIGDAASGSLTFIDPNRLKTPGSLITEVELAAKPAVVPGDHVDILVTECNLPGSRDPTGCETQITIQNVYVYTVRENFVFVVLTRTDALRLKYLKETGKLELAIRGSNDNSTPAPGDPVDAGSIVRAFNF
jgi:Flp pilus assembly protein CpaB